MDIGRAVFVSGDCTGVAVIEDTELMSDLAGTALRLIIGDELLLIAELPCSTVLIVPFRALGPGNG